MVNKDLIDICYKIIVLVLLAIIAYEQRSLLHDGDGVQIEGSVDVYGSVQCINR